MMSQTEIGPRRGLLIIDHGTRSADANAKLGAFARSVARRRSDWLVEHAHMEFGSPDFDAALASLVARGATEVFVHLHFLGAGFHVRESIPALVAAGRERHPGISISTGEPLGEDERLVQIVLDRMDERIG